MNGGTETAMDAGASKRLLFLLALCAGAAVANLYYAQPLLALIGQTFDEPTRVGLVVVLTQVGYTLGILFILPLGDLVDRRKLTGSLTGVLVLGTLACALAPSLTSLALASLLVGFGATITQAMVPLAADLASPQQRAHAVGVVFSGILAGILLARTVSGVIGEWLGWRPMFAVASVIAVALGVLLNSSLPRLPPKTSESYGSLLASLFSLLRRHRALRVACAIQACLFAIFTAFWSVLALLLAAPPFEMGPAVAGGFGLVGLVGVVAANFSGRFIDRFGSSRATLIGLASCVIAYVVFLTDVSIRGLVVGVVLPDFGLSIVNVSNQSLILGLEPDARSRINTVYVTAIFLGGALGAGVASAGWARMGWPAVATFGLIGASIALSAHLVSRRSSAAPT